MSQGVREFGTNPSEWRRKPTLKTCPLTSGCSCSNPTQKSTLRNRKREKSINKTVQRASFECKVFRSVIWGWSILSGWFFLFCLVQGPPTRPFTSSGSVVFYSITEVIVLDAGNVTPLSMQLRWTNSSRFYWGCFCIPNCLCGARLCWRLLKKS